MENDDVAEIAGLLKTMGHPIRLRIMCLLEDGEKSVGALQKEVKTTNANVSQHLTILRNQGIIKTRKEANFIYNSISDPKVLELMHTMRKLYCNEQTQKS